MKKLYAVMIGLLLLALLPVRHIVWAATVTVNSTTDVSDGDTSSIASLIASPGPDGVISLREAIEAASNTSGSDTINFNTSVFPLTSPATIAILSPLPTIGNDTTIDGSGAGVILDGSGAPGGTNGLVIDGADNVVIKGLQILNFPGYGIELRNGASNNAIGGTNATPGGACSGDCNLISGNGGSGVSLNDSGTMSNTVSGNYIGTDASGTAVLSNENGVSIASGAQHNRIGGATVGERNVIGGNRDNDVTIWGIGTDYNVVSSNFIGIDASGTAALRTSATYYAYGVHVHSGAQYSVIGGATPGERNVIGGNDFGIQIDGSDTAHNVVIGNFIGTNMSGTTAVGNFLGGVLFHMGAYGNRVGGSAPGEGNLISGNGEGVGLQTGSHDNIVVGNLIGTDASGTTALGNQTSGIVMRWDAYRNHVGGLNPGEGNLISGNGSFGVSIWGSGTMSNTVSGNYIGTDVTGTSPLSNGYEGVSIDYGASNNTIGGRNASPGEACSGECNLISGNDREGVWIGQNGTMSNTVSGNYIGTDATGTVAISNARNGVHIDLGAKYNVIGGDTAGERNLISGNGSSGVGIRNSGTMSNTISSNYIGTNASGTAAIGNIGSGVRIADGAQYNVIGGDAAGERNLISGNGDNGVHIFGSGTMSNTLSGNYIGTNSSGTAAISNTGCGVWIGEGAKYNIIGGDTAGERNLISGNSDDGALREGNGVRIEGVGTMSNTVSGNYIGTNSSGTAAISNTTHGVSIGYGAQYNVIGGDIPGERNLISGNGANGVWIGDSDTMSNTISGNYISSNGSNGVVIAGSGTMNNTVSGNYIGTDATGTSGLGNNNDGVLLHGGAQHNTIGPTNTIAYNGRIGVLVMGAGTTNNTVTGNFIGTGISGAAMGNTYAGVLFYGGAQGNAVGPGNTIAYNGTDGVVVYGSTCLRNTITGNSIYSNTEEGIDLVDGGNLELFPPVLTDLLTDTVKGLAPPNSTVEIFSDDEDEGRVFEGSTTADATSQFTFNKPSGLAGPHTTATATDVDGNTSEFSTPYSVTHDMALVAIFSVKPRVQVGGAVTPTVEVGNAGSSTEENVPVRVRVTTDPGGTEVYSRIETVDSISPLAYAFVTFDAWTPTATGSYHVEASVTLPGDENGANDAKEVTVAAVVGNPEVYIKDNPQDDGSVPTSNYWMSPDTWVRHEEDGGEEHQQPIADRTNYAYARVHSIGDVTLDNVTVDLYWHEPALAIKCGGWRHIGQYTISSLAPGVTEIIHLPWTPDVSGHTCLFAQIDSAQDPYARDHDCYEGVPWDNNLAQRNVEVVESAASEVGAVSVAGIRLDVVNVRSKPASVDVVVEKMEAFAGTLTLDLGEELFNRWQNATAGTVEGGQAVSGTTKVQITASVSGTIVGLPLYGDEEVEVVLEAEGQSGLEFKVDVEEWMDELLIGGNTYLMKLPYQDMYLPIILKGHSGS